MPTPAPSQARSVEESISVPPAAAPPGDPGSTSNSSRRRACGNDETASTRAHHRHCHPENRDTECGDAAKGGSAATGAGGGIPGGGLLDPRARWVKEWNRVFLLACTAGLFVDPLFFYSLSVSRTCMCLFIDGWFAVTVTALRCMTDALHVWNMWLRLKMGYNPRRPAGPRSGDAEGDEKDKAVRGGRREAARRYLRSMRGFFFDLFVILPMPQIVLWVAAPAMIRRGLTTAVMTVFLVMFVVQYLPKIYHSICLLRRTQNLSGYIFGTIWWGIALNMIAYFVAAHLLLHFLHLSLGLCLILMGQTLLNGNKGYYLL